MGLNILKYIRYEYGENIYYSLQSPELIISQEKYISYRQVNNFQYDQTNKKIKSKERISKDNLVLENKSFSI